MNKQPELPLEIEISNESYKKTHLNLLIINNMNLVSTSLIKI